MKAAVVKAAGERPIYAEFDRPVAMAGYEVIDVSASALSVVARSKASGSHYSSKSVFPFVAGVDGTGRCQNGRRVYFFLPKTPFGAMAEHSLVHETQYVALPDALDDVAAAAIAIPGMSSFAALTERARFVAGETVLINGATGTSGRLAVQIAKYLGAGKIIATGRNPAALDALRLVGADVTVSLTEDPARLNEAFAAHFEQGVDVVLDYLWGTSAQALLVSAAKALPEDQPLRFVQIGAIGGGDIQLPAAVLRSAAITLLGSGIGSVAMPRLLHVMKQVFDAAVSAKLTVTTEAVALAELDACWSKTDSSRRTVFIPRG